MILFFRQWQGELLKLFARRRTYIGFAAFLALEIVLFIVFRLQGVERIFERMISRQGQAFEHYYSALTLSQIILGFSVVLLGAIYLALVAGDIVAKEGEDGHYRLLLVRPISRVRLLFIKYLTTVGYTIALIQFITWSAFLSASPSKAGVAVFLSWCRTSASSPFTTGCRACNASPSPPLFWR